MEGPAQDAGPHPHGITEGLKQQKLSPSGEDKDPPELVSDPAVGLNTRGSGSQLRRLSPRACLNRQAGFAAARPAANSEWQSILSVIVNDETFL